MNFTGTKKEQALAVVAITIFSVISYGEILGYYFTDLDAFPLIKSGRIESLGDLGRIFTEPLMGNVVGAFPSGAFYRPVTTLSYSMDFWLWELNPWGYHLTDIALHTLTSIAVFYLVRCFFEHKSIYLALVTAIIFTIHPINMEVVPAIARRGDVLAALFLVLTLISVARYQQGNKGQLYVSMGLCALTLGSKEAGITVLPIIFLYLMLFSFHDMGFKERITRSLIASGPYFIIGAVYLCLHFYICENQETAYAGQSYLKAFNNTVRGYLIGLFFPSFNLQLQSTLSSLKEILVNRNAALPLLFVGLSFLAIIGFKKGGETSRVIKSFFMGRTTLETRLVLFFLSWLVISCGMFVIGKHFSLRYLYPLAIASSALLTLGFWCGITFLKGVNNTKDFGLVSKVGPTLLLTILSVSFVSQLYLSPVINNYDAWEESGRISKHALEETTKKLAGLPDNSELFLVNYPFYANIGDLRLKNLGRTRMLKFYCVQSYSDLVEPTSHKKFYGITLLNDMTSTKDVDVAYGISNETISLEVKKGGLFAEEPTHKEYKKGYFEVTRSEDSRKLNIHTNKDYLSSPNSYFLLYTGSNVEMIPFDRLAEPADEQLYSS